MGAVLWPFALIELFVSIAETCGPAGCSTNLVSLLPMTLSLGLIAVGVVASDLRPRGPLGLADLVGDITIVVAAVMVALTWLLGATVLLGSAFLLLFLGGVVYGIAGFRNQARPRWASALIAIGSGGVLLFAVIGGLGGTQAAGGYDQSVVLGIMLFAVGWAWLGVDLVRGRPVPITGDRPQE